MIRIIMAVALFVAFVPLASFEADREGSAEIFLWRDGECWVSARRAGGSVLLFCFGRGDVYCGGETRDALTESCGSYDVWSNEGQYFLKLTEKTGKVIRMPLEIKNDYTIILNGVEFRRRSIDQGKKSEKQREEKEIDDRIKAEIEYENKSIAIRNRRRMREELDALEERCQKKRDEISRHWNRTDLVRDLERLNKDCEKEAKQIREMYGGR